MGGRCFMVRGNSLTLLIVEDEDNIRQGIETYIKMNSQLFHKIYVASNGAEAIEKIFAHEPDAMLIDIQMPYKDGLTVMKEANAAGICPKTIILSGHSDFQYAQQAIRCGTFDYLLKPCRPMEILSKLEGMFEVEEKQTEEDNYLVNAAKEYIREHYMNNVALKDVAQNIGVTPGYLSTLFTQNTEYSFIDYLNRVRVDHACNYLHNSALKTYEVAHKVGFKDEKYFTKVFKKIKGISPSQYRKTL